MDIRLVSALAATLGSLVGGSATIATAWITQRFQARREHVSAEVRKKEDLFGEFITESSKLFIDSLDHHLDEPAKLFQVYALLSRIRLTSSDPVVGAAELAIHRTVDQYFSPNMSPDELRALAFSPGELGDPLKAFSEVCRVEVKALARAA
jgi:hypothetical protein